MDSASMLMSPYVERISVLMTKGLGQSLSLMGNRCTSENHCGQITWKKLGRGQTLETREIWFLIELKGETISKLRKF